MKEKKVEVIKMQGKVVAYDHLARGIVKKEGKVIFIPKCCKGEVVQFELVKEKKDYAIGTLCHPVVKKPIVCPHYFVCGGCQLQHLPYADQLIYKKEKVGNILAKYAKMYPSISFPIIGGHPFYYRNKVVLHIALDKVGFYQEQTKTIFPLSKCYLLPEQMQAFIFHLQQFVKTHLLLKKAMIRLLDGKLQLALEGEEKEEEVVRFFHHKVASLYYQGRHLSGEKKLSVTILGKHFLVSPNSFFQVNIEGQAKIYQAVIDIIRKIGSKKVLDLYCGIGTISLLISPYVTKVWGLEIIPQAILDAKENAMLNGLSNVSFKTGDVSLLLKTYQQKIDTIIVDPPRAGLTKRVRNDLLRLGVPNLIYVSCDPLTFMRDIADLATSYQLKELLVIDEFPNTYHVECVCVLNRR